VKRMAILLLVWIFAATPAYADGVKAVAGSIGMGAISSVLCVLTGIFVLEDEEEEDTSGEDFDPSSSESAALTRARISACDP